MSDTRVSWSTEPAGHAGRSLHPRLDQATLKVVVSSTRRRVLAFSGDVDPDGMGHLLRPFHAEEHDLNEELERLRAEAATEAWDFIVADAERSQLWKITDEVREVQAGLLSKVGDAAAHERFRLELDRASGSTIDRKMEQALGEVIDSGAHPTVGGLVVRVSTSRDRLFSYFPISGMHIADGDSGGIQPGHLIARSASEGAFVSTAFKCVDDYPAVAWWFPQAGTGFLLSPLDSSSSIPLVAFERDAARRLAEEVVGRPMTADPAFRGHIAL